MTVLAAIMVAMPVFGATPDSDGQLGSAWDPPATGNPPVSYSLSYEINGIVDSIQIGIPATQLKDSSAVLVNIGDWAVLSITSTDQFGNTSIKAFSDTVIYDIGTVLPPTGIRWE